MIQNRIAGIFTVSLLAIGGVQVTAQTPPVEKGIHWQTTLPQGFEVAAHASRHPLNYAQQKYRYQTTGKASEFFKEMGRPDKYSHQSLGLYLLKQMTVDPKEYPLFGVFKYVYKDGSCVYMETGDMDAIEFACIWKKGKKSPDLLYR